MFSMLWYLNLSYLLDYFVLLRLLSSRYRLLPFFLVPQILSSSVYEIFIFNIITFICSLIQINLTIFQSNSKMTTPKCYFHKSNPITTFCTLKQCTLPMCQQCLQIHLQQHQQNSTDPSVLPFDEATRSAIAKLQSFMKTHETRKQQMMKIVDSSKQTIIKEIENYFSKVVSKIEMSFSSLSQIEKKMAKLKKGSLKTLIFYYSGEINMQMDEAQLPNFDDLRRNFEKVFRSESYEQNHRELSENNKYLLAEPSESIYEKLSKRQQRKEKSSYHEQAVKHLNYEKENKPYEDRSKSPSERLGIFTKKSEGRNRLNTVQGYQERDKSLSYEKRLQNKYAEKSYERRIIEKKSSQMDLKEGYCYQNEESPISFEQRYQKLASQKHTTKPQIKIEDKYKYQPLKVEDLQQQNSKDQVKTYLNNNHTREQRVQSQNNHSYTNKIQTHIQTNQTNHINHIQNFNRIQSRHIESNNRSYKRESPKYSYNAAHIQRKDYGENNTVNRIQNHQYYQKTSQNRNMRSHSHANLRRQERFVDEKADNFQIKKVVMSPDEIKKMLQKRIEQRSRILANKRSFNGTERPRQQHIRIDDNHRWQSPSRRWDTKDSIINQINGEQ